MFFDSQETFLIIIVENGWATRYFTKTVLIFSGFFDD